MQSTIFIDVPESFSFRATVYSHGWSGLLPFELDVETWRLKYVFSSSSGPVPVVISEEEGRLRVDIERQGAADVPAKNAKAAKNRTIPEAEKQSIADQIRHILRLDDDLAEFYSVIAGNERLNWVSQRQAGRLLRSPTVFEDLVKTICTTNCSWGLTKSMVSNLVQKLGQPVESSPPYEGGVAAAAADGVVLSTPTRATTPVLPPRAFPTPAAMASVDAEFYRNEIKAGYRSPYFVELAEAVASDRLDPEAWLTSDLPTPELKKEMKKVKGVGDYAAENLLKLVGRYDGLALDSWLRSQFYKNHNKEKICPDKKIERHYSKYGPWRHLV